MVTVAVGYWGGWRNGDGRNEEMDAGEFLEGFFLFNVFYGSGGRIFWSLSIAQRPEKAP